MAPTETMQRKSDRYRKQLVQNSRIMCIILHELHTHLIAFLCSNLNDVRHCCLAAFATSCMSFIIVHDPYRKV